MSERWTNTANDKGELSEMLIQSLIETAVKQLRFSYTPYSHFKVGHDLYRMQYRECGLYTDELCGENGFLQGCQRRCP